jgi:hypothetical protein
VNRPRWAVAGVLIISATVLAGCAAPVATPATAAPLDLTGTAWSGTDSTGDATVFTFERNSRVAVELDGVTYRDPDDTWAVHDGTLRVNIYLDDTAGVASYTGKLSPAGRRIDATATTTRSHDSWTVRLDRD